MPMFNLLGHVLIFLTYKIGRTMTPNLQVCVEILYRQRSSSNVLMYVARDLIVARDSQKVASTNTELHFGTKSLSSQGPCLQRKPQLLW